MIRFAIALVSLFSFALLWIFLFWLYKDLCVESFRQKVFALRDELFDRAVSGEIPFDHKAYGRLRVTMNGAIRFAHQISLIHFLLVVARHHKPSNDRYGYNAEFSHEIDSLDDEQKRIFLCFQNRFSVLLLKQIFISSPLFLFTIILPLLSFFFFRELVAWLLKNFRTPLEEMQSMVYAAGDD